MALPAGTNYDLAMVTNPGSALTDFTLIVDLSNLSASWWSMVDTADGTKGRAAIHSSGTELATDWIDFDNGAQTGFLRVLWSGTLASSGIQQLRIYPPLSTNSSYLASDTYGSDNAYNSNWEMYMPLDETSGTIYDRTSNSVDGTVSGATSTSGKLGNAYSFDGTNDRINLGSISNFDFGTTTDFMISAWVNPSSLTTHRRVITNGNYGFTSGWFLKSAGATAGKPEAGIGNAGDSNNVISFEYSSTISTSAWTLLTVTFDQTGKIGKLYVNGSQVAITKTSTSGTVIGSDFDYSGISTNANHAVDTRIGGYGTTTENYAGIADEVQVHSAVRSADWIAEEYSQTNDNAAFWGSWAWQGMYPFYYYQNQMGGCQ